MIISDLIAYDKNNQPTLLVEIKKRFGASKEWATQLHRNIYAHGEMPSAKYFLLATPDKFYLWKQNGKNLNLVEPTYVIDSRPILQPYFERSGIDPQTIDGRSFELLIRSWLVEVIHFNKPLESFDESQKWLVESGLYHAITGGHLEYEVMV